MRHSFNNKSSLRGRVVAEWVTTVYVVGTVVCLSNGLREKGRMEEGTLANRHRRYVHAAYLSVVA